MKNKAHRAYAGRSSAEGLDKVVCDKPAPTVRLGTSIFDNEKLMTVEDLAERLNISRAHAYTLKNEFAMPFVKLGSALRFRWGEVERWLSKRSCT